jgi:hypothetical protein
VGHYELTLVWQADNRGESVDGHGHHGDLSHGLVRDILPNKFFMVTYLPTNWLIVQYL